MEREERRRPARRKNKNGALLAVVVVLLILGIAELALLLHQKKQIRELTYGPEYVTAQLTETQQEIEDLRAQAENYKDERDAYLEQLNELSAGAEVLPSANVGTVEAEPSEPVISGEAATEIAAEEGDTEEGNPDDENTEEGNPEDGGDEEEESSESGYRIVEDVKRIYEDHRYQEYAKENDPYDTKQYMYATVYSYPTDVVFLGDSLIERCNWNELFPDLNVKNRGIGGDTVNGVLVRLDTVMKTKPQKIFLMVGINNLMNGNSVDQIVEDYARLLDELVELRDEEGVKIYVESILPVGPEMKNASRIILDGREVNSRVKDMCAERDITYIDLTESFSNEDLALISDFGYDGVHINAKGYRVLRDKLESYVYEGFEDEKANEENNEENNEESNDAE